MTVSFRPLALGEVLGLGRSIVRDFHPYELRGYRYARRDILRGRAVALAVTVGGAYAGYLIHEKPDRQGLLRIAYLATEPRFRGQHIGEQALALLQRRYPRSTIYFEVEDPAFAENEEERQLMERRIGFYRRCGFSLLRFRLEAGPWHLGLYGQRSRPGGMAAPALPGTVEPHSGPDLSKKSKRGPAAIGLLVLFFCRNGCKKSPGTNSA